MEVYSDKDTTSCPSTSLSSSTWSLPPFTISADFDSGNLLKAEVVHQNSLFQPENHDYEISVWPRPDCHSTPFENGNRTWFYFTLKGDCKPNAILKVNVINLNKQSKLFTQGMQPVYRILPDEKPKWERIRERVVINENKPPEPNAGISISFHLPLPSNPLKSTTHIAFTYPFTYLEHCDLLDKLDSELSNSKSKDDIYYHRETLCYSLENRKVELITISSYHGISKKREERLKNLFPEDNSERPFKFPSKKVVFLSARVHPGETPSSFVLNGFIRFVLDKEDKRAIILRRLFVFKFIPILNPDGVARGHYRTDPRGVNLNRVYLNPSRKLHPSIYAAKKLIVYYHSGVDLEEEDEEEVNVGAGGDCCSHQDDKMKKEPVSMFNEDACMPPETDTNQTQKKPYTFLLSGTNSLCAGCVAADDDISPKESKEHHQCAFEACDEDSVFYLKVDGEEQKMEVDVDPVVASGSSNSSFQQDLKNNPSSSPRRRRKSATKKKLQSKTSPIRKRKEDLSSQSSISTSRYFDNSTGLFCYIDIHGHSTKRGIFMYGNHFPTLPSQAESMLLPRLMALNSPHFDFPACNFTERLMSVKDRKDPNVTREGSGRVACLKLTGLIRSYTLECNYNGGRPGGGNLVVGGEPTSLLPQKYTPELFQDVGKSLAETILDLSGQNPYSRLSLTEFKTVEGVKRSLINRLKLSPEFNKVEKGSVNQEVKLLKKSRVHQKVSSSSGPLGPKNNVMDENSKNKRSQQGKGMKASSSSAVKVESAEDVPVVVVASTSTSGSTSSSSKTKLTKVLKKKKKVKTKKKVVVSLPT